MFKTGTRVILTNDVMRYPHFTAPCGAMGTVTEASDEIFAVRLDQYQPGAEDWGNEVHWYPENGDEPERDLKEIKRTDAPRQDDPKAFDWAVTIVARFSGDDQGPFAEDLHEFLTGYETLVSYDLHPEEMLES